MEDDGLTRVIDTIYAAVLDDRKWPDALTGMARAAGTVGAALTPWSNLGTIPPVVSPSLDNAVKAYNQDWWRHDSYVLRARARGFFHRKTVFTDADLFDPEERRHDVFINEFLKRHGLGWSAMKVIEPADGVAVTVGFQQRGEFTADQLKLAGVLGSHAGRAVTFSVAAAEGSQSTAILADAVDRIGIGVVIIGPTGKATYFNKTAETLLGRGARIHAGRLRAILDEDQANLDRMIAASLLRPANPVDITPIALRRSAGRPLIAQAVPVSAEGSLAVLLSAVNGARAVVLISDPERESPDGAAHALGLMGLTPAEARLAVRIGSGLSPREASLEVGITERSARAVLAKVYAKLGVSRQAQLATLVSRLGNTFRN